MKWDQTGKQLHISWRIAAMCAGFLSAIALVAIADIAFLAPASVLLAAPLFFIIGTRLIRKSTTQAVVFFICAGLTVGLWRGSNEMHALQAYEPRLGSFVSVQGKVSEDVGHGDQGDTRMQLINIRLDGKPLHGKIWVSTQTDKQVKRNDTVLVRGVLDEGFGNISASISPAELTDLKPTSQTDKALLFRDWFTTGIRQGIPEPQASLGAGFLTGEHSSLPSELSDQLKIVGLTHAVVASGSNLTVLVGFTRRLFTRVSKYTATMAGALMTAAFILVAGFSPSMTRAGLVTGLSLAAWYYGRRIHPLVLLPLAGAITVMLNPSYLWGDLGWYLSFGAFAGVLLLAPLMQSYFWGKDYKPNLLMEIFIGTTAAQIATMPVILLSFGTYSTYALLANMLVIPLVPLAMLLTFISGIIGVTIPAVADFIAWPAALVIKYMTSVIDWSANLPGAQGTIVFGVVGLLISYAAMIFSVTYMWRKTKHNFRNGGDIVIGDRA
jgi:competence protein ComEC